MSSCSYSGWRARPRTTTHCLRMRRLLRLTAGISGSDWIVWLQRFTVLIDIALIWYFWIHLRSDDDPINGVLRKAWMCLGGAGTLCVIVFSTYLATFPGEWIK